MTIEDLNREEWTDEQWAAIMLRVETRGMSVIDAVREVWQNTPDVTEFLEELPKQP